MKVCAILLKINHFLQEKQNSSLLDKKCPVQVNAVSTSKGGHSLPFCVDSHIPVFIVPRLKKIGNRNFRKIC